MTSWFVLLAYVAAVNPPRLRPGLAAGKERISPGRLFLAVVAVAVGGLILVVVATTLLDALDITDETWRLGAGAICLLVGARVVVDPRLAEMPAASAGGLIPLAFPLLFTPQLAALAVLFGATESFPIAWGWLVVVVGAVIPTGLLAHRRPPIWAALARMLGASLVVVAIALIVAGIRDV